MKVKREEVKIVLIMFIFAVCRRKGSALCSVAVSVLLVWAFSRVGLLKRRPSFQPPVVMVQVSGGRGWRGGELERLLTSEAGRDINLGPLQSIH